MMPRATFHIGNGLPVAALVVFVLVTLAPTPARSAAFLIYEAGAKALGMGGAMAAQANDPSAVFFNPAGLCQLDGTQLYGGVSLITTKSEFAGVDPDPGFGVFEETGNLHFTPINAYFTHTFDPEVAIGIGVFNLYGLGQDWQNPAEFTGRHIVNKAQLVTVIANPVVAWRPIEQLSIAGGVQLLYGMVELDSYLLEWDPNGAGFVNVGTVELRGDNGIDFGGNAALLYRPNDEWSLGLAYRSQITAEFEGDADFEQVPSGDPALDDLVSLIFPPDQGAKTEVNFPWLVTAAAAYMTRGWVFEADLIYTAWSEFETLPFFFDNPLLNSARVQDYENTLSVRTGIGYDVREDFTLRAGYYYDPTPQPEKAMSPFLGDVTRHGVTGGVGYRPGKWTFDGFVLFLTADERSTDGQSLDGFNGTYNNSGFVFGVNVGYRF